MRLLKASDIQPPDDPARKLARKRERAIKEAIVAALLGLGGIFAGDAVIKLIQRLDRQALEALLASQPAQDIIVEAYQPIADTFLMAARESANDNFAGLLTYDPLIAPAALQGLRDQLASTLTASARSAVQAALLDSIRRGVDAPTIAESLRQVVGLNDAQQRAVANYRRMLQTGDVTALRRALRNQQYDALVRQAARGAVTLHPETVDRMVADYAARALDHRAATIASTEAMQAAVSGIRDPYRQAVKTGRLLDSEVRRFWLTAQDELVCPVCTSVPILNLNGVGVDDDYMSIDGPLDGPLAHPNCRCSERYVTNMSRLTEQPFAQAA